MSLEALNEQLLRSVAVGIALFDEQSLKLEFSNEVFQGWFEVTTPDSLLVDIFPDIDTEALSARLNSEGSFSNEIQFRRKRRTLVISQNFRRTDIGDRSILVLECNNISRIRELEAMIESYSRMVERNAREIQREKEQVEKLLLNVMPRSAYEEFRDFGAVAPQQYDSVVLLDLRFKNFDEKVNTLAPADLVSELNEIHSSFDRIAEQLQCERIRTTGDSYRCVLGIESSADNNLTIMARTATRFIRYLNRRNAQSSSLWACHIGIGAGTCVGSVVGSQKYVYDIFGQAVKNADFALQSANEMQIVAVIEEDGIAPIQSEDVSYLELPARDGLAVYRIAESGTTDRHAATG